jgi:hypothetical protein
MIIYVVHPYKGQGQPGERERNKATIAKICRAIVRLGHCPLSPVHALADFCPDEDVAQRALGLRLCKLLLHRADEAWVFGDWTSSEGCVEEVRHARDYDKPIRQFMESKEEREEEPPTWRLDLEGVTLESPIF